MSRAIAPGEASAELLSSYIGLLIKESGPERAERRSSQVEEEHREQEVLGVFFLPPLQNKTLQHSTGTQLFAFRYAQFWFVAATAN